MAQLDTTHEADSASAQEYLTFMLGAETYAVDILAVQEIRGYDKPVGLPNAPAHIKGVINLRGTIVPIIDLRTKLGFSLADYTATTVVIILSFWGKTVGVVVDCVSDVVALSAKQIQPAPQLAANGATKFITGLGTVDDKMLIIVDVSLLLGQDISLT